jgi:hypothetical protein
MCGCWKSVKLRIDVVSRYRCAALPFTLLVISCVSAHAQERQGKPPQVQNWSGPNVSLSLQNKGTRTEAERKLADCKSAADPLYREKRYEEAAAGYQEF